MRVLVNSVRLWFDVEGAGRVTDGPALRRRPTLLLLHGGPGADHSGYRPYFSRFADVAQVVYLDHRGNGRSDTASPETWNLRQWADDVAGFCAALGIERPIVYGASFGGMVAMEYATRYPDHPAGLVLVSTQAVWPGDAAAKIELFRRLGGEAAGRLAHRRFIDGEVDSRLLAEWLEVAVPLYTRRPADPDAVAREIRRPDVTHWFMRPEGESRRFDLRDRLAAIRCPTLVLGGLDDPMTPIGGQREIAAALDPAIVRYQEFEDCGHGVVHDAPDEAEAELRAFIAAIAATNDWSNEGSSHA